MPKTVVAVVRCPDYRPESLDRATERLQEFIGGFAALIKPNDSVFLKINHLGSHPPATAINTHPEVASSIARSLSPITTNVVIGDGIESEDPSPFETSGFSSVCLRDQLELVNFARQGYVSIEVDAPYCLARVPIARIVAQADFVVTVPKLKTHMLTLMTGAVKNGYGYLPQEVRTRLHRDHIRPTDFSGAVVDIFAACKPGFVVMDAIDALEGSGPGTRGTPRHLGLLIAGRDAVAVDAVASAIIGLDPMEVATTRLAHERGLGMADLTEIEVVGTPIAEVRCADFARPGNRFLVGSVAERMPRIATRVLSWVLGAGRERPRVLRQKCTGCGVCAQHCPEDAIEFAQGCARINYDECISCFCCLEFCTQAAIRPQSSLAGSMLRMGMRTGVRAARRAGKVFSRRKP